MSRGSRLDAIIWDQYADHPDELRRIADAIRAAAASTLLPAIPEADEGRLLARMHRFPERDRKLVERKKVTVLARQGSLLARCAASTSPRPTARSASGSSKPSTSSLAQAGVTTTRLTDLALVCSDCHRMLHRAGHWISPAQLWARMRGR